MDGLMAHRNLLGLVAAMWLASGCTSASLERPSAPASVTTSIVDAMAGGLIGGELGRDLDPRERRIALQAEYRALEHTPGGRGVDWQGNSPGRSGVVLAAQPYKVGAQDCRQYIHRVTLNQTVREARGTACRNPDGSWTPLS
jgi:surface antigen